MAAVKRIVMTGSGGFIGQALTSALSGLGEVWGISLRAEPAGRTVRSDLCDTRDIRDAIERVSPFDVLIHLAALAHGQRPKPPDTAFTVNTRMTSNLLSAIDGRCRHAVFFSSVAVYGEDRPDIPVDVSADLRPATEYGRSKQICEALFLESPLPHVDILRLAPVYDRDHLRDVRKRVFVPGLPVKIKLQPPPHFSLCHIDTVTQVVAELIREGPSGRRVRNVADPTPYTQHALADWFPGGSVSVPVARTAPIYWAAKALPGRLGYQLRCLYAKLFRSNVYNTSFPAELG